MPLPLLLHFIALCVLVGMPGWLAHRTWLRSMGFSWRVSVGLFFSFLCVLFSDFASIFFYNLFWMAGINIALILILIVCWYKDRSEDKDTNPKPPDLSEILFFAVLVGIFIAPALVLYLPLDTDAQGFTYIALMVREGGTIHTLSPWQSDVEYLYSPAMFIWWAYFSDLLHLPLHQVSLSFTHIIGAFTVLLTIDLGETLFPDSRYSRWVYPLMFVGGMGFFLTLMDSAYTTIFALMLVVLFLILLLRSLRTNDIRIFLMASLALASVALSHPDTIIILLIGYLPFYLTFWFSRDSYRTKRTWLSIFILIPAIGVALTLPWVIRVLPLFFEEHVVSPFVHRLSHIRQLVIFQGGIVPLLGLVGIVFSLKRRRFTDVFMLTWLFFIVDFSLFAFTDRIVDLTGIDIMRYVYPFSVAWHAPPIPYAYFATLAVEGFLKCYPISVSRDALRNVSAGILGIMVLSVLFSSWILTWSFERLAFFGTFSSRSDLKVMEYVRENTEEDIVILNYPYGFEGHWVPGITERESIIFRDQPFFSGAEPYYERMDALGDIYFHFDDPEAYTLIQKYGVTHILVPEIITTPESFGDMHAMIRWQWPEETWYPLEVLPEDVEWLELEYESGGAKLYRVELVN